MQIAFDNNRRLWRNVFYFDYKGIHFKLIQSNSRECRDVLLTIISDTNHAQWESEKRKAYETGTEFLAALSWENNAVIKVGESTGGCGVPDGFTLRRAKSCGKDFPRIPRFGSRRSYDICKIPEVQNQEQRDALALFREACASNNNYLAFLFLWHILKIGNKHPDRWVDNAYQNKRDRLRLSRGDTERLKKLVPEGESIEKYFREACRNAIAHISDRDPGKVKIKLDALEDNERITRSLWIVKEFARLYIMDKLELQKRMYLVRKHGKSFPVYISEEHMYNQPCSIAYQKPSRCQIRQASRRRRQKGGFIFEPAKTMVVR